jgi:hypothetical protein
VPRDDGQHQQPRLTDESLNEVHHGEQHCDAFGGGARGGGAGRSGCVCERERENDRSSGAGTKVVAGGCKWFACTLTCDGRPRIAHARLHHIGEHAAAPAPAPAPAEKCFENLRQAKGEGRGGRGLRTSTRNAVSSDVTSARRDPPPRRVPRRR